MFNLRKTKKQHKKQLIVLLHGIANPALVMTPIELFLKSEGYETLNIEYPSQSESITRLSKYIHKALTKKASKKYDRIHFVCFSLGGLVLRAYLTRTKPSNLGSVVMLGTPNQGTQAADKLKDTWYYKLFFGTAGQELTTDHFSTHENIDYTLGIIAGNDNSLSPVNILTDNCLPEPNDGAVSVDGTKIEGMQDHITLNLNHPSLITNKESMQQILNFIEKGKFKR